MRWLILGVFGIVGTVGVALEARAQAPQGGPGTFRPQAQQSGLGVGFYSRNYRAPGFSPLPQTPTYNAVSFYGKSYRAPGFTPIASGQMTLSGQLIPYGQLAYYGARYNAPNLYMAPSLAMQPSAPQGFTLSNAGQSSAPQGFTLSYGPGSYSDLNFYAPGSFPR
jgi:hypothetical protein